MVEKLTEQNGLNVDQTRDALTEGVTSALGQTNANVTIDIAAAEPDIPTPDNDTKASERSGAFIPV
ncbi:hypothetical protein MRU69_15550 [Kocuria flava]|uniref:hypothetical protein n=1 Tax=Kocuria flava TaxID=446860 RepID=UPI001FF49652|nr:hypothetical protein [Kocuria flava]MCJ8506253.1 hypothetical protein [Kocuria flava]